MMFFNYTATLQNIFESFDVNEDENLSNAQVIENGRPELFDFDYPIFDPSYKNVFETHFIRNFYIRQIGFETYGLFKFQLETWLNIHMPYFNKIFESELIQYNPLTNFKLDETNSRTVEKNQSDSKTTSKTKNTEVETTVNSETDSSINRDQSVIDNKTIDGTTSGNAESVSESSITGNSNSTKTGGNNSTTEQNNFERKLSEDTPDSRLAIQNVTDTESVIEYASGITENNQKNSQTVTQDTSDESNESSNVVSDGTVSDSSTVTTSSTENGNITTNDDTTSNSETNTTANENIAQTDNQTDSSESEIRTLDEYISSKTGKVGNQTYSSMILEYRNTLLRVERDIFKEMSQLFMLLY